MRDLIVVLVEHGFDRGDLMEMSHAELRWWVDGVQKRNRQKAEDLKRARTEAKYSTSTRRRSQRRI